MVVEGKDLGFGSDYDSCLGGIAAAVDTVVVAAEIAAVAEPAWSVLRHGVKTPWRLC